MSALMRGRRNIFTSVPEIIIIDDDDDDSHLQVVQHNEVPEDVLHHAGDSNMGWIGQSNSGVSPHLEAPKDLISEHGWLSSQDAYAGSSQRLEARHSELNNTPPLESVNRCLGNAPITNRPLTLHSASSNHVSQNIDLNADYEGRNKIGEQNIEADITLHPFKQSTDTDVVQPAGDSSNLVLISSRTPGSIGEENDGRSNLSSDDLRQSFKRKEPENAYGQLSLGESSNSVQPVDLSERQAVSAEQNASHNLNTSFPRSNMPHVRYPEQLNTRLEVTIQAASDVRENSSVVGRPNLARNVRLRPGNQQLFASANLSSSENHIANSHVLSPNPQSVRFSRNRPSDPRLNAVRVNMAPQTSLAASMASQVFPAANMASQVPHSVNMVPQSFLQTLQSSTWNQFANSRGMSSSMPPMSPMSPASPTSPMSPLLPMSPMSPTMPPMSPMSPTSPMSPFGILNGDDALLEGGNSSSFPRNGSEQNMLLLQTERGNVFTQNPVANRNRSFFVNSASASQNGSLSGIHPSSNHALFLHQSTAGHYEQRISEVVHRSITTSDVLEFGQHSGNRQPHSGAQVIIGGIVTPTRPPNAVLSRMQLRRGFLSRLRRHTNLHSQIPPEMWDWAERVSGGLISESILAIDRAMLSGMRMQNDVHEEMRLDIDNMSYEELLELEETIGDADTGLTEEDVLGHMKQKKYRSIKIGPPTDDPCCICQEEYDDGEDVGTLDCGHEFHTNCVMRWLLRKNTCPICKQTALSV
ncbi:E3 ubiquitin-protein ligase MBR2-like [Malania oleifera]|uniref:E3 ubiquitin-protein ligase MBR2-like n=1 Tax=Malania oleifera TaxID=397392 RepID=UPI0025ADCB34|nr:E3 ubiquitin-protein ligase MBR2-like [Malania oleifera]